MAEGLQINIFVGVGVVWVAALVALVMRVVARRMTKQHWWFDDYFCVSAFVFASGYNTIMLIWTIDWSLGQLMPESLDQATRDDILLHSRLLSFFNSITYAFSIFSCKMAILLLYWRLFQMTSIRIPIQIMLGISVIWIILRTFMVIFRCSPVRSYWDRSIPGYKCTIKDAQFFFGTVLTHFAMDIIILVLPLIEVFRLRLRLGQKIAVTGLFVIGTVVCLASVFVLIESINYDAKTDQMPYHYALNCLWATVEINIAIVSASFPLLRPIFRRILPSRFLSSNGSSQPISRPSRAIRLRTIHDTRVSKEHEGDDSSSTHHLHDLESGPSTGPSSMRDLHPAAADHAHTVKVVAGRYQSPCLDEARDTTAGIHVRNSTMVEVQEAKTAQR